VLFSNQTAQRLPQGEQLTSSQATHDLSHLIFNQSADFEDDLSFCPADTIFV
jgi:hypothetical protein